MSINMLTAGRSAVRVAGLYRCTAHAVRCRERHVRVVKFAQPVRAILSSNIQTDQRHLQWRCYASKVKSMPEKQLQGKEEAAEAGGDEPAPNDHYDKVADTLSRDSVERMGKASTIVQEALANMTARGPSHAEHESDERQLKTTCEEGKVAVRNVRRQVMQKIGRLARDGDISRDDQDRMADTIQELTDNYVDQIDDLIRDKRTKI